MARMDGLKSPLFWQILPSSALPQVSTNSMAPRRYPALMRTVETFRWYLPNPNPRGKPYLSRWAMTAAEAAARGAIEPALHTREVREVPETEDERRRAQFHYQSAGRDAAKPPGQ